MYHKLFLLMFFIGQFLFFPLQTGFAQDFKKSDQSSGEDLFDALEKSYEGFFDDREAKLEDLWTRMEAEEEAKWKRLEKEVLQKWDTYHPTTKKVWVDYSKQRDAVSRVDFESGKVVVEAIVPQSSPMLKEEGIKLIARQLDEIKREEAGDGKPVLKDMLSDNAKAAIKRLKEKSTIKPKPVAKKARKKVEEKSPLPVKTPDLKKEKTKNSRAKDIRAISVSEPFKGKDGVVRVKVKLELEFVPGHIKKRAFRYISLIKEYAEKNGMEAALVLAVMHTESFFNPKARSHIPAYGLMQLVPKWAAKEAYQQLYGQEKVLSSTYLYKPKNNIELGVTYLSRLHNVYFKGIADLDSRRFISVAAYNWGPTAMRRKIVSKEDINNMTPEEVFELLQKRLPQETKDYLKRIEKRRKMYSG